MEDLFDGNVLIPGLVEEAGLEDDAEGAVANDFAVGVLELLLATARLALVGDDLDDLVGVIDRWAGCETRGDAGEGGRYLES